MYSEENRKALLDRIVKYMASEPEFEGLLQIGSGATGYTDIYSDIDLMAGCFSEVDVSSANRKLITWFENSGAVYVDKRSWSATVLGLSVYYENGLSVDLSFMPTPELVLRSPAYRILFTKTERFEDKISACDMALSVNAKKRAIDDSIHHRFVYALRRCRIACLRGEYVYADMVLTEARQMLLKLECVRERKKQHQFKAFNTLRTSFLDRLEATYPVSRNRDIILEAQRQLLALYLDTVELCDELTFDAVQLKLLACFD